MIIVMKKDATTSQMDRVVSWIKQMGQQAYISQGEERTVIGIIGDTRSLDHTLISQFDGVENMVPIEKPFKLANREFHPQDTVFNVGGVEIGGERVVSIAGPCAVESFDQMLETARSVKEEGAQVLRGGAFKPRTSPYSFQGLGEEGLRILSRVREETGLPVVTEVMQPELVSLVSSYADVLQVGARNMQNFALLHAVGKAQRPVMLKRGMMSTMEELLLAAEYILLHGNPQVILCERGIRTFETYTRNTLDISAIPLLKQLTHLPVMVDPSHATGKRELVEPVSMAAVAAGADGVVIEVHPNPEEALSDGAQSLKPEQFAAMMKNLNPVAEAVGRKL